MIEISTNYFYLIVIINCIISCVIGFVVGRSFGRIEVHQENLAKLIKGLKNNNAAWHYEETTTYETDRNNQDVGREAERNQ